MSEEGVPELNDVALCSRQRTVYTQIDASGTNKSLSTFFYVCSMIPQMQVSYLQLDVR